MKKLEGNILLYTKTTHKGLKYNGNIGKSNRRRWKEDKPALSQHDCKKPS